MKITRDQILKMEAKIRRDIELEEGRINYKKIRKSKKIYDRNRYKKIDE